MDWNEVLSRDDIVDGDLELHCGNDVYRGPITSVERVESDIVFTWSWTAVKAGSKWRNFTPVEPYTVSSRHEVRDMSRGEIFFIIPVLGYGLIFPKGGLRLEPSQVEGLEVRTL